MTTTTTTATTTTGAATVERFLDAIAAGRGIPTDVYAPGAVLDATVPNWRFAVHGPEAIANEYGRWFASPGCFEELARHPIADGEVVTYLLTWREGGVPHAAHHCHVLRLAADGRIANEQVFCGGRWDAALLADIAAAGHAG